VSSRLELVDTLHASQYVQAIQAININAIVDELKRPATPIYVTPSKIAQNNTCPGAPERRKHDNPNTGNMSCKRVLFNGPHPEEEPVPSRHKIIRTMQTLQQLNEASTFLLDQLAHIESLKPVRRPAKKGSYGRNPLGLNVGSCSLRDRQVSQISSSSDDFAFASPASVYTDADSRRFEC
jgi:hypothetical protein